MADWNGQYSGSQIDALLAKINSSEVFTLALKTKLEGIAAGAEVNVQADWSQTDDTADDYIKNKPTIPTVPSAYASNPAMDGSASPGSSADWARGDHVHPSDTSKQNVIDSSHKLDSDNVSDASPNTNKFVTAAEKTKIGNAVDTAGTGLSKTGSTFNHSNSVSQVTTESALKVKYDAQGHITGSSALTKSDISLSNVDNVKQVAGLASGTTQNNLVTWGANGYAVGDAGVAVETTLTSNSNAKVPTSKAVADYVGSIYPRFTYVDGYIAIDYGS